MPIKYVVAISFEATLFSSMYQTHEQWFPEIISEFYLFRIYVLNPLKFIVFGSGYLYSYNC